MENIKENIEIFVSESFDGYNFTILPSTKEKIKRLYPIARPMNSVFIRKEIRENFEDIHSQIDKYIYPILIGLPNNSDFQTKINSINFVDSLSNRIINSIKDFN